MKKITVVLMTLFVLFLMKSPALADGSYYQTGAYYQYNTPNYYDNSAYTNYNDQNASPTYYIDSNDKSTLYSLARYNSASQPTCPLKNAKRYYHKAKKAKRVKSTSCPCKTHYKAKSKYNKVKHVKQRVKKPCR